MNTLKMRRLLMLCALVAISAVPIQSGGQHDVGMIAEEVGEVLPEIVGYEENGRDATGMDYSRLTPLLVEAVKALKIEVDQLRKGNADLRNRLEALEKMPARGFSLQEGGQL